MTKSDEASYPHRASLSQVDSKVRIEPVFATEPVNRKLHNSLFLGQLFPEFIPNVVVPQDEVFEELAEVNKKRAYYQSKAFPSQSLEGQNLYKLIENGQLTFLELIQAVHSTVEQMRLVWEKTGVLLLDREAQNVVLSGADKRVYQVDHEFVFDAIEVVLRGGKGKEINNSISFEERQVLLKKHEQKLDDITRGHLSMEIWKMFDAVQSGFFMHGSGRAEYKSLQARTTKFQDRLHSIYENRETQVSTCDEIFDTTIQFLKQFMLDLQASPPGSQLPPVLAPRPQ